jgi:periplasmic copper chaperone A
MRTALATSLLMLALLVGLTPAIAQDGMKVSGAYVQISAQSGAMYMTIANTGDTDDRLVSVQTDAAAKSDMHSNAMSDTGMMQMLTYEDGVVIPAQTSHAFAPAGDHVMLMGLTAPLADGDTITATLTFATAGKIVVIVPVRAMGAGMDAMKHIDHQMEGMVMPPAAPGDAPAPDPDNSN